MIEVRVSLNARLDLLGIATFIADDSERTALKFVAGLEARFEFLAASPRAGRMRPDLRRGVRAWAVGSYLILYRIGRGHIEILRVVHGSRDVKSAWRHPPSGRV